MLLGNIRAGAMHARRPQPVVENEAEKQAKKEAVDAVPHMHDFFRFYPLEIDKPKPGAKPVAPLPHQARVPHRQPQARTMHQQHARQKQVVQPQVTQPHTQQQVQTAAEQFKRINSTLPDGVMYEPLDEETLRILKAGAQQPPVLPAPSVPPAQPPAPQLLPLPVAQGAASTKIIETLQQLAQDEYNATSFYASLSLQELSKGSEARHQQYLQILQGHLSNNFTPVQKELQLNIGIEQALSLAMQEENKALVIISLLLEEVEGTPLERALERILAKKLIGHQLLVSACIGASK